MPPCLSQPLFYFILFTLAARAVRVTSEEVAFLGPRSSPVKVAGGPWCSEGGARLVGGEAVVLTPE